MGFFRVPHGIPVPESCFVCPVCRRHGTADGDGRKWGQKSAP